MMMISLLLLSVTIQVIVADTDSTNCPYKCTSCSYFWGSIVCSSCMPGFQLSDDNSYCVSQCPNEKYYIDYISLDDTETYQNSDTSLPCTYTCNIKDYYPDQVSMSCRQMKPCPMRSKIQSTLPARFVSSFVKTSVVQDLIGAYAIDTNQLYLWRLSTGIYIGLINIIDSTNTEPLVDFFFSNGPNPTYSTCIFGFTANYFLVWDSQIGKKIDSIKIQGPLALWKEDKQGVIIISLMYTLINYVKSSYQIQQIMGEQNLDLFASSYQYDYWNEIFFIIGINFMDNSCMIQLLYQDVNKVSLIFTVPEKFSQFTEVRVIFSQYLYLSSDTLAATFDDQHLTFQEITFPPPSQSTLILSEQFTVLTCKYHEVESYLIQIIQPQLIISPQLSLQINVLQKTSNKFIRIIEIDFQALYSIPPEALITSFNILDPSINNIITLFVAILIPDLQITQSFFVFKINLTSKTLLESQMFSYPSLPQTAYFLAGYSDSQILLFLNSDSIISLSYSSLNSNTELDNNYIISSFKEKLNLPSMISFMLEDQQNNKLIFIDSISRTINTLSLFTHKLISTILPSILSLSSPIQVTLTFASSHSYILCIYDDFSLNIYNYDTTQLIFQAILPISEPAQFLQLQQPQDFVIIFTETTILKYSLSNDGLISTQLINTDYTVSGISSLSMLLASPSVTTQSLFVFSKFEFSVYKLDLSTLEQLDQFIDSDLSLTILSSSVDQQTRQINLSTGEGSVKILDENLNTIHSDIISSPLSVCFDPTFTQDSTVACRFQMISNIYGSTYYCHGVLVNSEIICSDQYVNSFYSKFDQSTDQLTFYGDFQSNQIIQSKQLAKQHFFQKTNTLLNVNGTISSFLFQSSSQRRFFLLAENNEIQYLEFEQDYEKTLQLKSLNNNNLINNVSVIESRHIILEIQNTELIIYDLNTYKQIYSTLSELPTCSSIDKSSVFPYYNNSLIFICNFKIYSIIEMNKYSNLKLFSLSSSLDPNNLGVNKLLLIDQKSQIVVSFNDRTIKLFNLTITSDSNGFSASNTLDLSVLSGYNLVEWTTFQDQTVILSLMSPIASGTNSNSKNAMLFLQSLDSSSQWIIDCQDAVSESSDNSMIFLAEDQFMFGIRLKNSLFFNGCQDYSDLSSCHKNQGVSVSIPAATKLSRNLNFILAQNSTSLISYDLQPIQDIIFGSSQSNINNLKAQTYISNMRISASFSFPNPFNNSEVHVIASIIYKSSFIINIYDQLGSVVFTNTFDIPDVYCTDFAYDEDLQMVFFTTNINLIIGISPKPIYSIVQQFYTECAIQALSQTQITNQKSFIYFSKSSNQIIVWNKQYLGVVSQWNTQESTKPAATNDIPVYHDIFTGSIFFVTEANQLWKFTEEKIINIVFSIQSQYQPEVVFVSGEQYPLVIVKDQNSIQFIKGQTVLSILEILPLDSPKIQIVTTKANNNVIGSDTILLFDSLLAFCRDRTVKFIDKTYSASTLFTFKAEIQFECYLGDEFVISSDFTSSIVSISLKINLPPRITDHIDLTSESKIISMSCSNSSKTFIYVDSNYVATTININDSGVFSIISTIAQPVSVRDQLKTFSSSKLIIDLFNNKLFVLVENTRNIIILDNTQSTFVQAQTHNIIPPGPFYSLEIHSNYITTFSSSQINFNSRSDLQYIGYLRKQSKSEYFKTISEVNSNLFIVLSNTYLYLIHITPPNNDSSNTKESIFQINKQIPISNEILFDYSYDAQKDLAVIITFQSTHIFKRTFSIFSSDSSQCYYDISSKSTFSQDSFVSNLSRNFSEFSLSISSIYLNYLLQNSFMYTELSFPGMTIHVRIIQNDFTIEDLIENSLNNFDEKKLISDLRGFTKIAPQKISQSTAIQSMAIENIYFNLTSPAYNDFKQTAELSMIYNFRSKFSQITFYRIVFEQQFFDFSQFQGNFQDIVILKDIVFQHVNIMYSNLFNFTNAKTIILENIFIDNCLIQLSPLFAFKSAAQILVNNFTVSNSVLAVSTFVMNSTDSNNFIGRNINIYNNSYVQYDMSNNYRLLATSPLPYKYGQYHVINSFPYVLYFQSTIYKSLSNCRFYNNSIVGFVSSINQFIDYVNIQIADDYLELSSSEISNNEILQDTNSNHPFLNLTTKNTKFWNITVKSNYAPGSYGMMVLNGIQSGSQVKNSTFYNNTALDGGGIYLVDSVLNIIDCSFDANYALRSGGVFALERSQMNLYQSNFRQNKAPIGGFMRFKGDSKEGTIENCVFERNQAEIFGDYLGDFKRLTMTMKGEFNSYQLNTGEIEYVYSKPIDSDVSVLSKARPGVLLSFLVQFYDQEGRLLSYVSNEKFPKELLDELTSYYIMVVLSTEVTNGSQVTIDSNSVTTFSDYLEENKGILLKSIKFSAPKILSDSEIQQENNLPISERVNFYINTVDTNNDYNLLGSFPFVIQFRSCEAGEKYTKDISGYVCNPCPSGTYSLSNPKEVSSADTICQPCPSEALSCSKNHINLYNGYWKASNETDNIQYCFHRPENCIAESNNQEKYCAEGYAGPRCESCDNYPNTKQKRYVMESRYHCKECTTELTHTFTFNGMLMFILMISFIFLQMNQIQTQIKKEQIGHYLRITEIACVSRSCACTISSYKLKQVFYFLQIVSALNQIALGIPDSFNFFNGFFGQQPQSLVRNIQCAYLTQVNTNKALVRYLELKELPLIDFQLILSLFLPIIYFGIVTILKFISIGIKQENRKASKIFGLFQLICFIFIPNVLSQLFSAVTCSKISDEYFLNADLKLNCFNDTHARMIYIFFIPGLIFWMIIPILTLIHIKSLKHKLTNFGPNYKYGYLYSEYQLEYYYWEFIRIFIRTIIGIGAATLPEYDFVVLTCSFFVLLMYLIKICRDSPYKYYSVKKFDMITHFAILSIILLNLQYLTVSPNLQFTQAQSAIFETLTSIIFFGYLTVFLWSFLLDHYYITLIPLLVKLSEKNDCVKRILPKTAHKQHTSMRILKLWKTLAKEILTITKGALIYKSTFNSLGNSVEFKQLVKKESKIVKKDQKQVNQLSQQQQRPAKEVQEQQAAKEVQEQQEYKQQYSSSSLQSFQLMKSTDKLESCKDSFLIRLESSPTLNNFRIPTEIFSQSSSRSQLKYLPKNKYTMPESDQQSELSNITKHIDEQEGITDSNISVKFNNLINPGARMNQLNSGINLNKDEIIIDQLFHAAHSITKL